ncbi:MAG: ATPase domain-containing protein [Candidatus Thermoplasmatota archaeon]
MALHIRSLQAAGQSVLYLAADRPQRQLVASFEGAGVDAEKVEVLDVVTCMDGRVPSVKPARTTFLPSPTMLEMMAMRLEQMASRMTSPVVVVDSLNTLALYNGLGAVQEFSHYLANRLRTRSIAGDFIIRDGKDGKSLQEMVATFTDERLLLTGAP